MRLRARALGIALLLSTGCVQCFGPRPPATGEPALLRVRPVPEDARVRVDDEAVVDGRVIALQPVSLSVGRHLVTVEADGFFPHDLELDLPSGETTVDIRLRPLPP